MVAELLAELRHAHEVAGLDEGDGIHHPFEAGRQADAELHGARLRLSPRRRQRRGDRRHVVGAADDHLVEAEGAIFLELGLHLGRRAAGRVAAHHVVAHQAVDLAPVLGGIGGSPAPPDRAWRRTAGCSRHGGRRAARSRSAGGSDRCLPSPWRRAWCRRCRACGTAGRPRRMRPRRGRPSRRAARSRPRSARRRSRGRRASACWGARPRARSAHCARRWPGDGRTTRKTSPWKSVISPASSERQILIASPIVLSGRGASMPAALRSAGAPTPRQRMTRPGYISSRLAAAMAMKTGCSRVGTHRHQRDLDAPGGAQRQRRHGDGIAQVEMAGDPQRRGAALLGGARLGGDVGDRRAAVHRDAELSHGRNRRRRAAPSSLPGGRR